VYLVEEMEKRVWERARTWEDELYYEYLVTEFPSRSPHTRRLLTTGLASLGARLARWGEWLVRRADAASTPVEGGSAQGTD
jgi:hypothetical protein